MLPGLDSDHAEEHEEGGEGAQSPRDQKHPLLREEGFHARIWIWCFGILSARAREGRGERVSDTKRDQCEIKSDIKRNLDIKRDLDLVLWERREGCEAEVMRGFLLYMTRELNHNFSGNEVD
jgi:hypothetical protein